MIPEEQKEWTVVIGYWNNTSEEVDSYIAFIGHADNEQEAKNKAMAEAGRALHDVDLKEMTTLVIFPGNLHKDMTFGWQLI